MQSMRLTHAGLRRRINRMQYATPPDDVGSAISLMDEPHRYDGKKKVQKYKIK